MLGKKSSVLGSAFVLIAASCASDHARVKGASDAGHLEAGATSTSNKAGTGSSSGGAAGCSGSACDSGGGTSNAAGAGGTAPAAGGRKNRGGTAGTSTASGGAGGAGKGGTAGTGAGGTTPTDAGTIPPGSFCPATGACAVMPLGDSITYGQNSSDDGGYRSKLFHLAHTDGKALTFVGTQMDGPAMVDGVTFPRNHEGYPGYTIDDAKDPQGDDHAGITPFVLTSLKAAKPNIVFLMIGTNDMRFGIDLAHAPDRLGILMDKILGYDSKLLLVVAQILPTTDDGWNANTVAYNAAIPGLVTARANAGKHVMLIDMYSVFASHSDYRDVLLSDQVHPSDMGYQLIANAWYKVLKPLLH